MKFKYHYLENKLWRIEENNFYEVSEENRKIEHFFMRGTVVTFKLGKNHCLVLLPHDEWNYQITFCYTKPCQDGEITYYEKKIKRKFFGLEIETIIEFTEEDRVKRESG